MNDASEVELKECMLNFAETYHKLMNESKLTKIKLSKKAVRERMREGELFLELL